METVDFRASSSGCLAQLVEHRLYTARVGGSIPSAPTNSGVVVQLVRIPACHAGGRGFESRPLRHFLKVKRVPFGRALGYEKGGIMLQSIHDKLKGWLAGVVLGAIGLVFVFWGINWTMTAPSYAAKVNGSEVSANDVRQSYQQKLAQAERQAAGSLSEAQRNDIKKQVLDDYVNSEALVTRADALGYRVSDADLLKAECQIPAFQVEGKCDAAHAIALLR